MTICVIAPPCKPLDFGVLEPSVLLLVLTHSLVTPFLVRSYVTLRFFCYLTLTRLVSFSYANRWNRRLETPKWTHSCLMYCCSVYICWTTHWIGQRVNKQATDVKEKLGFDIPSCTTWPCTGAFHFPFAKLFSRILCILVSLIGASFFEPGATEYCCSCLSVCYVCLLFCLH